MKDFGNQDLPSQKVIADAIQKMDDLTGLMWEYYGDDTIQCPISQEKSNEFSVLLNHFESTYSQIKYSSRVVNRFFPKLEASAVQNFVVIPFDNAEKWVKAIEDLLGQDKNALSDKIEALIGHRPQSDFRKLK